MGELWDFQATALDKVRDAVRGGIRRLILQIPTGGGKTRLAAEIVNSALEKRKRVTFTVPAISLIDQTVEMFYAEGIRDVGVIQANHPMTDYGKPVQVASIQTLQKRSIPETDVVIRDEAHMLYKFDLYWMAQAEWAHVPFIGLSATPWTKGLGRHYEELIVGATTAGLIKDGYLAPFRVFAPTHPDLSGVRTQMGDYHEGDLARVMNKNALCADIVETWKQKAEDRPTICFAVDRAHAKALQERFSGAGVPAAFMDCETPLHERSAIRRQFERGAIRVVANVDVIGVGVDWPDIACISYCRPTKSEMRFVQNVGRGLRKAEGKKDLLILDHSDTSLRLGFVSDIHHDALNDGKEQLAKRVVQGPALPKECKSCGYLNVPGALKCGNCGKVYAPQSRAVEGSGQLGEFNGEKQRRKKEQWSMAHKAQFLAELKAYAAMKNYKPGWASNKYREKFEVWPANEIADVGPAKISVATMQWIRSRQIAWAKSKNNLSRPRTFVENIVEEYGNDRVGDYR